MQTNARDSTSHATRGRRCVRAHAPLLLRPPSLALCVLCFVLWGGCFVVRCAVPPSSCHATSRGHKTGHPHPSREALRPVRFDAALCYLAAIPPSAQERCGAAGGLPRASSPPRLKLALCCVVQGGPRAKGSNRHAAFKQGRRSEGPGFQGNTKRPEVSLVPCGGHLHWPLAAPPRAPAQRDTHGTHGTSRRPSSAIRSRSDDAPSPGSRAEAEGPEARPIVGRRVAPQIWFAQSLAQSHVPQWAFRVCRCARRTEPAKR